MMLTHDFAMVVDIKQGVIDARVTGLTITFIQAHGYIYAGPASCTTKLVGGGIRNDNGIRKQDFIHFIRECLSAWGNNPYPLRVCWNKSFRKCNERSSVFSSF